VTASEIRADEIRDTLAAYRQRLTTQDTRNRFGALDLLPVPGGNAANAVTSSAALSSMVSILGTWARALRRKQSRQRRQAAPGRIEAMAGLEPGVSVGDDLLDPGQAAGLQ
jgi:hypothetical protein